MAKQKPRGGGGGLLGPLLFSRLVVKWDFMDLIFCKKMNICKKSEQFGFNCLYKGFFFTSLLYLSLEIVQISSKCQHGFISLDCHNVHFVCPSLCLDVHLPRSLRVRSFFLSLLQLISYKKIPGVYTHSMESIYLSLVHTGSWGNLFHEIPLISTIRNWHNLNNMSG